MPVAQLEALHAGQSYQVAGTNSYATPDAANVGLSSGLDTRLSDYVSALTIVPNPIFSFIAKARFDVDSLAVRRLDLAAIYNFGALTGSVQFANYEAQPVIGYDVRREGLANVARVIVHRENDQCHLRELLRQLFDQFQSGFVCERYVNDGDIGPLVRHPIDCFG